MRTLRLRTWLTSIALASVFVLAAGGGGPESGPSVGQGMLVFERALKWESMSDGWRDRRDAWIAQVNAARTPAQLAQAALALESGMGWQAVNDTWAGQRDAWVASLRAADDAGDVAKAVLALENATKWEAVSDQWAGARDAWVARMRGSPEAESRTGEPWKERDRSDGHVGSRGRRLRPRSPSRRRWPRACSRSTRRFHPRWPASDSASRSRVERSCADEGGTWSGDACELGSGADRMLVTAEACRGRKVCRVSMIDTDRFPAEDVAGWVGRFQSRRRTLVERHGEPSVHRSRTDCARAVLDSDDAACIVNESGNSVSIAWSVGGGRVVLRLYKNERRRSLQIEERYESPTAVAEDAEVEAPVRH